MSTILEFEGKNIDQALAEAKRELNIPPDQIQYEVLTYGSTGIFGLVGVKKARIRVTVKTRQNKADTPVPPLPSLPKVSEPAAFTPEPPAPDTSKTDIPENEAGASADALNAGRETLSQIVRVLSNAATIDAAQNGSSLSYMISGGNTGVLIGKRGQTLEAIQYLVEKVVNKKNADRYRIVVDVAGYLEKREAHLQDLARRMAEKAKKTKKPVTLGQMNAHDRRIVHLHLKDEAGVRTHSVGDGYYRKLMIFPKKQFPAGGREKN